MPTFDAGSIEARIDVDRTPFQAGIAEARREGERFEERRFEAKASIDTSDARRELASVAIQVGRMGGGRAQVGLTGQQAVSRLITSLQRQLAQYARTRAVATVGLTGQQAVSRSLGGLNRSLGAFGRQRAVATVAAHGAPEATADLRLSAGAAGLARLGFRGVEASAGTMGRTLKGASTEVGGVGLSFSKVGPAAALTAAKFAAIITVGKPLVIGLAAVVSSAAKAAAGLGALGIAAGGALVAGLVLGAATVARFNRQAQQSGTMANRVARELRGLRGAFARVMAPGADRVLRGVASALQSVRARIGPLRGAFTQFGNAVGRAIRTLGRDISRLIPSFSRLVRSASPLAGHIARGISGLARILLNIARAAMPFLVSGARSVANTLQRWGRSTTDVRRLQGTIKDLVGHLKSWLNLGKQVGGIFLGVFKALAGSGKSLVNSLADGAKELNKWVNKKKGQEQLKKVFEDMKPVLKDIWSFIKWSVGAVTDFGKWATRTYKDIKPVVTEVKNLLDALVDLFGDQRTEMQKTQRSGEGFRSFMKGLANVIGWVADAVKWLDRHLTGNTLTKSFDAVGKAVNAVLGPFKSFGKIAGDAINWVKGVAKDALRFIKGAPGDFLRAGEALLNNFWNGMKRVAGRMLAWARGVWRKIRRLLPGSEPEDFTSPLRNLGRAGEATITNYLSGIRSRENEVRRAMRRVGDLARGALLGGMGGSVSAPQIMARGGPLDYAPTRAQRGAFRSAISEIQDTFRGSESGLRSGIIQRVREQFERRLPNTGVGRALSGLQREESTYQRNTAIGDLNLQLAEANMMRDALGAGRIKGEIESTRRQFLTEQAEATVERLRGNLEQWAGRAERGLAPSVERRLREQQGVLARLTAALQEGRISPESFRRSAHRFMLRRGVEFDLQNEAMGALQSGQPRGRSGPRRRVMTRERAGDNLTVNIGEARVRSDEDIPRLAREVSRQWAREQENRQRARGRRTRGAPAGVPAG